MTEDTMKEANVKAYGECINNIDSIASWGSFMIDNTRDQLVWATPDGYIAQHVSKATGVDITVYTPAAYSDKGFVKYTVTRDMPLSWTSTGKPVYESAGKTKVKNRGLYANITHSLDAYALRCVIRMLLDGGYPFIMKHDDYMVPPCAFDKVIDELQIFIESTISSNYYQNAINDIARSIGGKAPEYAPKIILGDAEAVCESRNFLMP